MPKHHEPCTWAESNLKNGLIWFAFCSCGWRGPDRENEFDADWDRLAHDGLPIDIPGGLTWST